MHYVACSTCISGQQFTTRSHSADARSHRYRATDIKISLGGPEDKIRPYLEKANVPYQVCIISMFKVTVKKFYCSLQECRKGYKDDQ